MTRRLSLSARQSIFAATSDNDVAILTTIEHADLATPMRFSSHPTARLSTEPLYYGTVSNGETFYFSAMSVTLPDDNPSQPPRVQLTFENVSQDQVALLRSTRSPAMVTIDLVLVAVPDDIEARFSGLMLADATYDAGSIVLDCSLEPVTAEPWPARKMTQSRFPGLFR